MIEAIKGQKLRALILEDDVTDAELIVQSLRRAGFDPDWRRVDNKVDYLKCLSPGLDVILADYNVPLFNAPAALRLMRERGLRIPFIIVSGHLGEETAVAAIKEGADDYLLKDRLTRLGPAVSQSLENRRLREQHLQAMAEVESKYRVEEKLLESEANLARAQRIARLGSWEMDLTGSEKTEQKTLRWSDEVFRIFGYEPGQIEVSNENFFRSVHPDDRTRIREAVAQSIREHTPYQIDHRILRPDGAERIVHEQSEVFFDAPTGLPLRMVGTIQDITERVHAEVEIQKLAAFAQCNPNPVLEFAADGRLNYFNLAAMTMAKSLNQSHPLEVLPPHTAELVAECLATGQSKVRLETTVQKRVLSWSFYPIQELNVVHCYAVDSTERQNLEQQLRQSQKMDSIGQLAGGVAHDFNNILTVIQGHAALLLEAEGSPPEIIDSAREISLAAGRAAGLTRQLLTFSRKQVIQPKALDLNEVVRNTTNLLQRLLGEDISLQVEYSSGPAIIHADAGMVEQILLNLAVNSRDAMPKGGKLAVSALPVTIGRQYTDQHPLASPGQFICLRVSDTGYGIPAENLPHIFEPFYTTKDIGKGTGLGLATVYGIVQQHHGWIDVTSEAGQGTAFQIYLPVAPASALLPGITAAEATIPGGTETIFLVEDEKHLRDLVRRVLEQYGYRVLAAPSGLAALEVWRDRKDQIQLLLTDLVMPGGMTGFELAQKLQAERPALKIIYTSGYTADVVGPEFLARKDVKFLQKPYLPQELARVIREHLDSEGR